MHFKSRKSCILNYGLTHIVLSEKIDQFLSKSYVAKSDQDIIQDHDQDQDIIRIEPYCRNSK